MPTLPQAAALQDCSGKPGLEFDPWDCTVARPDQPRSPARIPVCLWFRWAKDWAGNIQALPESEPVVAT